MLKKILDIDVYKKIKIKILKKIFKLINKNICFLITLKCLVDFEIVLISQRH